MNRSSFSVGIAVLFGGLVGLILAQQITGHFFTSTLMWFVAGVIGAIFGGIVAYIAFDFKIFVVGVKRAWDQAINWRPNPKWWKLSAIISLPVASVLLSILVFVFVVVNEGRPFDSPLPEKMPVRLLYAFAGTWFFFSGIVSLLVNSEVNFQSKRSIQETKEGALEFAALLSPVGIPLAMGLLLLVFTSAVFTVSREVFPKVGPFFRVLFVYTHCTGRTVSGFYGIVAVITGHFFGGGIPAVLACALIAMLNYELFTVGMLRAAPAKV